MTRYAVDLDGTLADTVSATLEIFNERYSTRYTKADVTEWRFWNSFPELQMLPESKRKNIILRIMDEAWISGRVRPEPGAAEFMRELTEREPQVDIVTGRSVGTPTEVIERWLDQNGIPYRNLVRVRGSQEKVYHGYDLYVDDDPNLAMDIEARWPDKGMLLVEQPWNHETLLTSGRVSRVRSLRTALARLPSGRQERLFRRAGRDVRVRPHRRREHRRQG
jgi:uncharacterized HAD superfamily protein